MAHLADEVVGITAAGFAAYMAAKAKQSAESGSPVTKTIKEAAAQRLPNLFGFGRADEQIFESLRQLVSSDERRLIDLVIGKMRDYEADIFRLTVAGMPYGNEVVPDLAKNPKGQPAASKKTVSWELTPNDLRVKYLNDIAGEVSRLVAAGNTEQAAAASVVKAMRKRRLITRSPAAQKAYELWVDATKWTKANVLDFFGVESFNEITADMVAQHLNELAQQVPEVPKGAVNQRFWVWAIRHHPVSAVVMALGIILTIAFFAFV